MLSQSELYRTRNRSAVAPREGSVLIRVWGRGRPEAAAGFVYPRTETFRVPSQHSVLVLSPHSANSTTSIPAPVPPTRRGAAALWLIPSPPSTGFTLLVAFPRSWWLAAFLAPARHGSAASSDRVSGSPGLIGRGELFLDLLDRVIIFVDSHIWLAPDLYLPLLSFLYDAPARLCFQSLRDGLLCKRLFCGSVQAGNLIPPSLI
jgi:hypothetical protein